MELNTTNGIVRNEFYGNLKLWKPFPWKAIFYQWHNWLGMNSKYLKFEIMRPTPWKNTFDIGNLVDF